MEGYIFLEKEYLILSKKVKSLDNLAAKKYAYFWGSYGDYNKYISGKFEFGFGQNSGVTVYYDPTNPTFPYRIALPSGAAGTSA